MIIQKLTKSQHVQDRYIVELDNGQVIKTGTDELVEFSLYAGRELTDTELDALREKSEIKMALQRAYRILGARSLSRRELIRRLIEKGEDASVSEEVADRLERVGAVNDAEYAQSIVKHYQGRGYGLRRIRDELFKRGIPRELWDDVLCEMADPEDAVLSILHRKLRDDSDERDIKRVTDLLKRRGFSWSDISNALSIYKDEVEDM